MRASYTFLCATTMADRVWYHHEARDVTQRIANERGKSVFLYRVIDPDEQCPEHGVPYARCDADHDAPVEVEVAPRQIVDATAPVRTRPEGCGDVLE